MDKWIYFDNNATTSLDLRVYEAMDKELKSFPSNPSSVHHFGQMAKARLAKARTSISNFLKVKSDEIIFTSSGTEAMNMIIRGVFNSQTAGHIITSNIEHACVHQTIKYLEANNSKVTYLTPNYQGSIHPKQVQENIRSDTTLIALSLANSETGVKTDIASIAKIAKERGILLVVDGVAVLGKEPFEIVDGISAIGFSPHKFHGPKGIGFAYISSKIKFFPLHLGGAQEYLKRAGTENLVGIIGAAKAVELLNEKFEDIHISIRHLRDQFENNLITHLDGVHINGEGNRICNTSNLYFENINAETLLIHLDCAKICASHGSACTSGAMEPSRVLLNMGYSPNRAKSSVRFSFSRENTKDEVDRASETIIQLVKRLRAI